MRRGKRSGCCYTIKGKKAPAVLTFKIFDIVIPALIIWLVKKYFTKQPPLYYIKLTVQKLLLPIGGALLFLSGAAQDISRSYTIQYKGDDVGTMQLAAKRSGDDMYMRMTSNVAMHFIVSINVQSEEEATFKNGKLVYSKASRKVNGKQKVNNETRAAGDIYKTVCDNKTGSIRQKRIDYNFLMLYMHEPVDIHTVYSDNFQQFLIIRKTSEHAYKIDLPDGNYNIYFFKDGICNKVEIHHSLYTINMLLK